MHYVGCIQNYQDGRVLCYYVSNNSCVDTDIFMFVIRWYVDMLTTIVTYSCMVTDIFVVLHFSKYETLEHDVNAKS